MSKTKKYSADSIKCLYELGKSKFSGCLFPLSLSLDIDWFFSH